MRRRSRTWCFLILILIITRVECIILMIMLAVTDTRESCPTMLVRDYTVQTLVSFVQHHPLLGVLSKIEIMEILLI